jgi:hypothetical protein
MKSNTTFIFAGIMSAIVANAYATGENIMTSKSYVDAQDATKQDVITTGLVDLYGDEDYMLPAIVTTNTAGTTLNGNTIGILDHETAEDDDYLGGLRYFNDDSTISDGYEPTRFDNFVPTARAVGNALHDLWVNKQEQIAEHELGEPDSLLTDSIHPGAVQKRSIYNDTAANYNSSTQSTYIPTMGAVMSAVTSGANAALPTGTTGTVVTYNGTTNGVQQFTETAIASAATHNPQTGALTNGSDIANVTLVETEIATRETKMTCAGWPDGVEHTDANCWLWQKN